MERTETGITLTQEEVVACGINATEIPHHVPSVDIPTLAQRVTANIGRMRGAHDILMQAVADGSGVVTPEVLEKSQNKITGLQVVHEGLVNVLTDDATQELEAYLRDQ